jgi:hypothetical protein
MGWGSLYGQRVRGQAPMHPKCLSYDIALNDRKQVGLTPFDLAQGMLVEALRRAQGERGCL